MAINSEAKRWSMLGFASGSGRNIVFNPNTSGLVSIEKITVLKYYGGIAWDNPAPVTFVAAWAFKNNLIGGC
jgi:hypothetical protein